MQVIEAQAHSNAPREAVWRLVADARGWSRWGAWSGTKLEREGTPPPGGVGAIKVLTSETRRPVVSREEVTVFEPPSRFGYKLLSSGLPLRDYDASITLDEATGGGTDITWRSQFDPKIPLTGGMLPPRAAEVHPGRGGAPRARGRAPELGSLAQPRRREHEMEELTDVLYEVEDGLATITINRPERMNAFRARTIDELNHCMKRAWASGDVGVVCLTGAGDRAFCTGGDQKQRAETGDYGPSESGLFEVEYLHRLIREIPKPVIAAVNGYAIGGGHVLHVLCDLSIASDNAVFGQTGPRVGSFDAGLRLRLPGARRGREAGARDLVPVPPVRRGDGGALGPREQGRAAGGAARRGAPLGGRDARAVPHRAAVPEAVVQRRHRAPRRRRPARVHRARACSSSRRRPRRACARSPRSARRTSRGSGRACRASP